MDHSIFQFILYLMFLLAIGDLVVGVSNDAVNFTNSAVGSKAGSKMFILTIAAIGVFLGAVSSSGMMEVARKGIFKPELFTLQHLVYIFLAVMITDVLLLDFYNTFGLPTSTTVSLVFELFGASLVLAFLIHPEGTDPFSYINSQSALKIISGIFVSILVAFLSGILIQIFFRTLFGFNIEKSAKYLGALFASLSTTILLFFIIISGIKGSTFIPESLTTAISEHLFSSMLYSTIGFFFFYQILVYFKVNVFRIVILFGTMSLAMAFAGNDLVNFVGVPLASYSAISLITNGANPNDLGVGLAGNVSIPNGFLLAAAAIMILTLFLSRKAQTVTKTEVTLASEKDEYELFSSNLVGRRIVQVFLDVWSSLKAISPKFLVEFFKSRYKKNLTPSRQEESFDALRASVNILTASFLIMSGTLYKLPLSTTFVTFMVAMGTSLADRAWGRENAVSRVSGVLTVVAGWFLTAMITTVISGFVVLLFHLLSFYALFLLLPAGFLLILLFGRIHKTREKQISEKVMAFEILRKSPEKAIDYLSGSMKDSIVEAGVSLDKILQALETGKRKYLKGTRGKLEHLSDLYGSYLSRIAEIDESKISNLNLLSTYSLETSIHKFRLIINNIISIRKSVVFRIENFFIPLSTEEQNDLKDLRKSTDDLFEDLKQIQTKSKLIKKKGRENLQNLAGIRYKIHKSQIRRVKSGKSKIANSIPFLMIAEELMDLNNHLIDLYENLEKALIADRLEQKKAKKKSNRK